ncbi:hypothetical protein H6G97_06295 [Nostoc flagelliforme FACHB-838]|uniref:Uncharacterized protein n=1 Tax=Nostoc flagelliforme FACHB-838 TaxID=2692904 RepID=A0ABR8DIC8_9NOSO|nr:hypothetical protein [Nostoc flagelliforme FACHB-838]
MGDKEAGGAGGAEEERIINTQCPMPNLHFPIANPQLLLIPRGGPAFPNPQFRQIT